MTDKSFDPNAAATHDGIYGLPYGLKESKVAILGVPWEVTTSYRGGTSKGPAAILDASSQVDLFHPVYGNFYENGIHMLPIAKQIKRLNADSKALAQSVIKEGGAGTSKSLRVICKQVDKAGELLNAYVYSETDRLLDDGKIAGIVGGDHSVPFGAIQAYAKKYYGMSILHFDAHADVRDAYEGFKWSHASIMRNVNDKLPRVGKIVQVGIRDYCEEEVAYTSENHDKIKVFHDRRITDDLFSGYPWEDTVDNIIKALPSHKPVYISFDIDGLDPTLCPHTGTPVPGGLSYRQATYLIEQVARNRTIVGFDLNEVAPGPKGDEWDANVGARILYEMIGASLFSQRTK